MLRLPYPVSVSDESGTRSIARLKWFVPFGLGCGLFFWFLGGLGFFFVWFFFYSMPRCKNQGRDLEINGH